MSVSKSGNRDASSSKVGGRISSGLDHDVDENQEEEQDDDDMPGGGPRNNRSKNKNKNKGSGYGCGCGGDFSKAKVVALFPFTKAKKLVKKKFDKRPSSSLSSRTAITGKSCFCLKQTFTLESPADSQTSDPNDPRFTFGMLRTLIEKNDFYSKECNTHLDATHLSSSNNRK